MDKYQLEPARNKLIDSYWMQSAGLLQQQNVRQIHNSNFYIKKIHSNRYHGPFGAAGPKAAASLASIMIRHCISLHYVQKRRRTYAEWTKVSQFLSDTEKLITHLSAHRRHRLKIYRVAPKSKPLWLIVIKSY